MALPELKSNILPDNEIITTHTQDGAEVISQLQQNPNSVESYVSTGNTIQTTHNVVPQVLTVLKENGQDITTIVEGFWDVVWSVNGQTGDVTIDAVVGNFIPNHTYRQHSIILHDGQMYRALTDFTTVAEFDPEDWVEINPKSAIVFDLFQAHHHYYARQPIWRDDTIYVANDEFTSGDTFDPDDWTGISGGDEAAWGNISGTLSDQTDLQAALDAKQGSLTAGNNITITDGVISSEPIMFTTSATGQDIKNALAEGKLPILQNDGYNAYLASGSGTSYTFVAVDGNIIHEITVSGRAWSVFQYSLENQINKTAFWNSTPNNTRYPTEKLVKDSLDSQATDISTINGKIPSQASASNQLADKNFVNSTVQTGTANFRGNWENWASVPTDASQYPVDYAGSHTPTVNDYLVVRDVSDYSGETLEGTWRFKYSGTWGTEGKSGWNPEYQVNEKPMTAAQLAALNSGITQQTWSDINTTVGTNSTNIVNLDRVKVDKVEGKGLSTNDYTTTEKNKLSGIASGAEVNVQSDWNQTTTSHDAYIKNKPTKLSQFTNDSGFTTNTGTITAVKANGTSVATSGEANIPAASTSAYGVTKLSTSTSSTSTSLAATASAVKSAYDLANGKATVTVTTTDPGEGATIGTNEIIAVPGAASSVFPVGSIYQSATLTTASAVASALGGSWTLVNTDYNRQIREIHDIAMGVDTSRSGDGNVSKTAVSGAYNYGLLESGKNASVPSGYHREYNVSAEVKTGGGNNVTIYINNIASNSAGTWSGDTFHNVVSTGWFKQSDITLTTTLGYSNPGCNFYYAVAGSASTWRIWKPQVIVADALNDPIYIWKRTA